MCLDQHIGMNNRIITFDILITDLLSEFRFSLTHNNSTKAEKQSKSSRFLLFFHGWILFLILNQIIALIYPL